MIKTYKDLTIVDMRALLCVLKPKYKTQKAQYGWIMKSISKILDDRYGINPIFSFSVTNTQVFISIISGNSKTTLVSNISNILK